MSKMSISINKKAFTLVEVMVSAVIITLVLVGILFIFVQTLDISKRIDCEYIATNRVKNRLEHARAVVDRRGFDFLSDELEEDNTPIDIDGDGEADLRRTTAVTENYTGDSGLKRIDVSITYKYRGEWKTDIPITMTTVFTELD